MSAISLDDKVLTSVSVGPAWYAQLVPPALPSNVSYKFEAKDPLYLANSCLALSVSGLVGSVTPPGVVVL